MWVLVHAYTSMQEDEGIPGTRVQAERGEVPIWEMLRSTFGGTVCARGSWPAAHSRSPDWAKCTRSGPAGYRQAILAGHPVQEKCQHARTSGMPVHTRSSGCRQPAHLMMIRLVQLLDQLLNGLPFLWSHLSTSPEHNHETNSNTVALIGKPANTACSFPSGQRIPVHRRSGTLMGRPLFQRIDTRIACALSAQRHRGMVSVLNFSAVENTTVR